jgi:hypothetical protein
MTLNEVRKIIYQHFLGAWNNQTPVDFANEKFVQPLLEPWVRITIKSQPSMQVTIGPTGYRKFRRSGILFAQVFTPIETGANQADDLAEEIRDVFEAIRLSGIWFQQTDIFEQDPNGKWYSYTIQTPFTYEDQK